MILYNRAEYILSCLSFKRTTSRYSITYLFYFYSSLTISHYCF